MSFIQTERDLSNITDEGLFEKLATAILRDAEQDYRALVHTGTNADGKTMKSPVDGIYYKTDGAPPHLYVVHHTIAARTGLRKKWLHDPAAIKTRGDRRTSTQPGDVLKAIELIAKERERIGELRSTIILTTNQEPDVDTIRDTKAAGLTVDVNVDIWTRSRLAHFLDNTAKGHWLRRKYLEIDAEVLSRKLLLELSDMSIKRHAPRDLPSAWIERDLDKSIASTPFQPVTFVVARSGFGKSVATYKWIVDHVGRGGAGLVLAHEMIANALTISEALDTALRQLCPSLRLGAGADALALSSIDHPLYLIVEDVNRSGSAAQLAERIERWSRSADGNFTAKLPYRLLCPIWPEILTVMGDEARKAVSALAVFGTSFTAMEGREAVQRRAVINGRSVSEMTADAVSSDLGHDPLLIALHNPLTVAEPGRVISQFIEDGVSRVAITKQDYTSTDYSEALHNLAIGVLRHRTLTPDWLDVRQWSHLNAEDLRCLSHLIHDGTLLYIVGHDGTQRIVFRHDRVRDGLLINACNRLAVRGILEDEILGEPYFAEIVGGIIARQETSLDFIAAVRSRNPLGLFHALRLLPVGTGHYQATLHAIEEWLSHSTTHSESNRFLRWEALAALSHTEGPDVTHVVSLFKSYGSSVWQARFRNGDVGAGIEMCCSIEPGVSALWRDAQLEHVKLKFGANLVRKLDELLRRQDLDTQTRRGVLRLTGHVADPILGDAILACWNLDTDREPNLADYLWACSECCGSEPERYLEPICSAWARLPAIEDASKSSPRHELAANQVRWAFRKWVPTQAIRYFVRRGEADDLREPIVWMLHEIDDPFAVMFVVQQMAEVQRRVARKGGFSPLASQLPYAWRRLQEEGGVGMSESSREPLRALWTDPTVDKYLRNVAFDLWAATHRQNDIVLLSAHSHSADLENKILHQRILRGDQTAIPALLEKFTREENVAFWWLASKHVWCDELLQYLDLALDRSAAQIQPIWGSNAENANAISDALARLSPILGERLLVKYWQKLKYVSKFVQVAIYLATPPLIELVKGAVEECPEPKLILEHIGNNIGLHMRDHPGITRQKQIESLRPYLSYMHEYQIRELWELCNSRGWFAVRDAFLKPYMEESFTVPFQDESRNFSQLDDMAESEASHRIQFWLESFSKTGASTDRIVGLLGKWLSQRKTLDALRLIREALILIGRRSDLSILQIPSDLADSRIDDICADTSFGVKRRTLNLS